MKKKNKNLMFLGVVLVLIAAALIPKEEGLVRAITAMVGLAISVSSFFIRFKER